MGGSFGFSHQQQDMNDFFINYPAPSNQKIHLFCKTLGFYLRLFLLVENVKQSQGSVQDCHLRDNASQFPNFTSVAGLPFNFKLPIPAKSGPTKHYKFSLENSALPHWMEFRPQTGSLSGLALAEDCGTYQLKVSVTSKQCAAYCFLHILNTTLAYKDSLRGNKSFSEDQTTTWASLLLDADPETLGASQRIHLSNTVMKYLHLPPGSVYLFTRPKTVLKQQSMKHSFGGWKSTGIYDEVDALGHVAQLVWPVSCRGEIKLSQYKEKLEYGVNRGELVRLLEVPVLGWELIFAPGSIRHKIKRHLQTKKVTSTPHRLVPTPTLMNWIVQSEHSQMHSAAFIRLEPSFQTLFLNISPLRRRHEYAQHFPEKTILSAKYLFTADISPNMFKHHSSSLIFHSGTRVTQASSDSIISAKKASLFPENENTNSLLEQQVFSAKTSTLSSSDCVEFGCSHPNWFVIQKSSNYVKTSAEAETKQASELTSHQTPRMSERSLISSHFPEQTSTVCPSAADSTPSMLQSPPLHGIYPSLQPTPVPNSVITLPTRVTSQPQLRETPLWTGSYTVHHRDSESWPTLSSLGPIIYNKGTIRDFNTAKPTLHNLPSAPHQPPTEGNKVTPESNSKPDSNQSLPPSNETPSTLLFPDVSPTSHLMTEHLSKSHSHSETIQHLSSVSREDVMSHLNVATQDVSLTTRMGQLTTSGQTALEFSHSVSSLLTFTPPLSSKVDYFGGQLETMKVLSLDDLFMSLPPTLKMSSPLSKTHAISSSTSSIFKDQGQPSVMSDGGIMQLLTSIHQPSSTLLFTDVFSGKSTGTPLHSEVLTKVAPIKSETYVVPYPTFEGTSLVFEEQFVSTAPPTAQESYTTSIFPLMQTLDPSFPLYGLSAANSGTQRTQSGHLERTVDFMTSYPQDRTDLPFDSRRQHLSVHANSIQSKEASTEQADSNNFFSWQLTPTRTLHASPEMIYTTVKAQVDISDNSGSSVSTGPKTSTLSGDFTSQQKSLLISDSFTTDSRGHPTQQIPSTYLSKFDGISTTLLPSSQTVDHSSLSQQSSPQPTLPSTSILSSMNLPPLVHQSLPALVATVGFPFNFLIPPKTFFDPEDGDADALSLNIKLIDGPPASIGVWLLLDGLELHGVPLEVDLQFSPQDLILFAQDRDGLSAWLPLSVDIRHSPFVPCHIFTFTAQRSFYSIIHSRHKVEILIRKISLFFNSSSFYHLAIVSLRPGSTVVSWYNHSLCVAGECNADQIQSMWMAMRSQDGSVNPLFREAMLPEFPIFKVGPVSVRQNCFQTTSSPTFDGSTSAFQTTLRPSSSTNTSLGSTSKICLSVPTANSHQKDHYQWMAATFTALLVVCLLILIVLLVAVVLHFCKARRRSRAFAIWPAGRVAESQSRDKSAVKPRRPPIFLPELPPPPIRLWINLTQGVEGQTPNWEQEKKSLEQEQQPNPSRDDSSSY